MYVIDFNPRELISRASSSVAAATLAQLSDVLGIRSTFKIFFTGDSSIQNTSAEIQQRSPITGSGGSSSPAGSTEWGFGPAWNVDAAHVALTY